MKNMKRLTACVAVLSVILLGNLSVFAAQTGCDPNDHDWRLYERRQVYAGTETCTEGHNQCTVYVRGYNDRYRCSICGEEKGGSYTEKEHRYVTFP